MSIIYEPHVCPIPRANTAPPQSIPLWERGTIWECPECGGYWRYREQFAFYLGEWNPVHPWNLIANHRIRKANK